MASPGRLRFLITAGPTREYIDPVRYISNDSSGRMGFALATAAVRRGHRVTLVHGPVALPRVCGARCIAVGSAADMHAACREQWPKHDVLIMAAAVADYAPARPATAKRKKSSATIRLVLRPTVDILTELSRQRRRAQTVIGFALEDRDPRRRAAAKLRRKTLDAIVLNHPKVMSAPSAAVEVYLADRGWQVLPRIAKSRLAPRLIRIAEQIHRDRTP